MDISILKAILERWNIEPERLIANDGDGLNLRIQVQKMMYLLQNRLFHADVLYSYGMYLHGPYSPELSRDYYMITASTISTSVNAANAVDQAGAVLYDLSDFVDTNSQLSPVEAAELLGTALYFFKRYRTIERTAQAIYTVKPKLKNKHVEISEVILFLNERCYLRDKQAA